MNPETFPVLYPAKDGIERESPIMNSEMFFFMIYAIEFIDSEVDY